MGETGYSGLFGMSCLSSRSGSPFSLVQPNKRDRPNEPEKQVGSSDSACWESTLIAVGVRMLPAPGIGTHRTEPSLCSPIQ